MLRRGKVASPFAHGFCGQCRLKDPSESAHTIRRVVYLYAPNKLGKKTLMAFGRFWLIRFHLAFDRTRQDLTASSSPNIGDGFLDFGSLKSNLKDFIYFRFFKAETILKVFVHRTAHHVLVMVLYSSTFVGGFLPLHS